MVVAGLVAVVGAPAGGGRWLHRVQGLRLRLLAWMPMRPEAGTPSCLRDKSGLWVVVQCVGDWQLALELRLHLGWIARL